VQGGIAYIGSVCNAQYAFGVSQVFGSFDLSSPTQIWDVVVTTHEMGHNLGSPHTHCYSPEVDKCYNHETGCYSGPVVASRGTIMSYCHLLSGGLANIDLVFGPVVSTTIRNTAEGASCLAVAGTCGNGVLETGEQCDDDNTTNGDGCSAQCRVEACGNGVVDVGEGCDDGNTTSGDGCSATCVHEPRCGDRVVDAGETCDDGNTTSGDGCSATCAREPRCGDGVLDPGEKCDDGNGVSGDGCSASCKREPCKVMGAGQTVWTRAQMTVQRGAAGRERLSLHGAFTIAVGVDTLAPRTTGIALVVEDPNGEATLEVVLPAGPRWLVRRGRWIYKDPTGSVAGIRKLEIADRTRSGVPEVDVKATGRGGRTRPRPRTCPPP
jgi:cysteine-rich repeat protein